MPNVRNNNPRIVPEVSPGRPVVQFNRAPMRAPDYYPGISFRSSLLKAQQRYAPTVAPVSIPKDVGTELAPATGNVVRLPQQPGLPYIGTTGLATPAPIAAPAAVNGKTESRPMALQEFPKPEGDNGRGMHWVPTTSSTTDVVDRFVQQAKEMKIKWMVVLNEDTKVGDNDYLVKQLVTNGIMPVMRVYTPNGNAIQGDLEAMVNHYRPMGVYYYQLYNEPNLNVENPDGVPSPDGYLDKWIPAAKAVARAGGLPGFGSLAPGGNFDDMEFLGQTLDKIKQRGDVAVLDKAWLSMHNYTLNHPLDYFKDSNGFMKFRWYDSLVKQKLGRGMPIIGTEGGTHVGATDDKTFPAIDQARQVDMVTGAYRYMKNREPYNFAYSYWVIANEEGGGQDPGFTQHALFKSGGKSPVVDALKRLD